MKPRDPIESARELLQHGRLMTRDQIRVRQAAIGVIADGIIGPKTRAAAQALLSPIPAIGPRQRVLPISHGERVRRFGAIRFVAMGTPTNPERVILRAGWAEQNITSVHCPQLERFGRPYVNVHDKAASAFLALWRAWDDAGLLDLIESWNGSWVPRFKRPSTSLKLSIDQRIARCKTLGATSLSNHSWGTAFDVNARMWPLGKPVPADAPYRQLIPIGHSLGWFCGADYRSRPDGMHWEYAGK